MEDLVLNDPTPPRVLGSVAAGGLLLGAVLPWVKIIGFFSFSVSGLDVDWGLITAGLAFTALAVIWLIQGRNPYIGVLAIAAATLAVSVGYYIWIQYNNGQTEDDALAIVRAGEGIHLSIISSLLLGTSGYLGVKENSSALPN